MNYSPLQTPKEARQTWLKSILLKYGRRIFDRFAYLYTTLCALPRSTRRRLKTAAGTSLTALALALALGSAPTVQAATITVDGDGTGGTCSLADAITAANSNMATGNCIAGDDVGGYDTIDIQVASATVVNGTITSNVVINGNGNTLTAGGADRVLYVNGGDLTLNEAVITGGNTMFDGGGILSFGGTLTINNSTVSGNIAGGTGGGVRHYGTLNINSSTISGNTSQTNGGGVYQAGDTIINNSTISGNDSVTGVGGGIYVYGSGRTAIISDSTITDNTAVFALAGSGGGIFVRIIDLTLNRTIVSGNTGSAAAGSEIGNFDGIVTLDNYNVIGYGGDARVYGATTGASDVVPAGAIGTVLNTTLANNGVLSHPFTHALVAGSPAVDIIPTTDSNCNPGISVDQRGAARANGASQGGTACDAGAFEYASSQTPTAVIMGRSGTEAGGSSGGLAAAFSTLLLTAGTAWAAVRRKKVQLE